MDNFNFYDMFDTNSNSMKTSMENRNVAYDKLIRVNDSQIYVGIKNRLETTMLYSMELSQDKSLELFRRIKQGETKLSIYRFLFYYMPNILRAQLPSKKIIKNYTSVYTKTAKTKSDYGISVVVNREERIKNASCMNDLSFLISAVKAETVDKGLKFNRKQRDGLLRLIKEKLEAKTPLTHKLIYFRGPFFKGTNIKFTIMEQQLMNNFSPLFIFLEWFKKDEDGFKAWLKEHCLTFVFEGATGKTFILSGLGSFTNIRNFKFNYIMRLLHMIDGKSTDEIDEMAKDELSEDEIIEMDSTDDVLDDYITDEDMMNDELVGKINHISEVDEVSDSDENDLQVEANAEDEEKVVKDVIKEAEDTSKNKGIKEKITDAIFREVRSIDIDNAMSQRTYMIDDPEKSKDVSRKVEEVDTERVETVLDDIMDIEETESEISDFGSKKDYFAIIDSKMPDDDKSVELIEQHNYTQLKSSVESAEIRNMRKKVAKNQGRSIEEVVKDLKTHKLDVVEYKNVDPESNYRKSTVQNLGESYKERIAKDEFDKIVNCGQNLTYPVFTKDVKVKEINDREFLGKEVTLTLITHDLQTEMEVKLDIPEVRDNKMFIGGSWKHMSMQNLSKVVIKTDENVIITTEYNKVIMELNGKYGNMRSKMAISTLKAFSKDTQVLKVKTTDALGEFIYNNRVSYNLIHINRHFLGCVTEDINIDLRGLSVDEATGLSILGNIGEELVYHNPEEDKIIFKGEEFDSIDFFMSTVRSTNPDVFDKCVVRTATTTGINTPYAKIMGKSIPIILLLCVAMPLKDLLEKLKSENNLEYKVVKNSDITDKMKNTDKFGVIRLQDYTIILKYNNDLNEILLTPLTELDLSSYDTFDITNVMEDYVGNANTSLYIENFIDLFIGPETQRICRMNNIPDDFVGLFIYACSLFTSYKTTRKSDSRNYRLVTVDEIINRCVYDVITKELSDNAARMKRGSRAKIVIPKDAVIRKIQSLPSVSEANPLSPFRVVSENSEVTLKGHMGINEPRAITTEVRAFNPNNFGTETTATSYSGTAGVTKHLPFNPVLTDLTGAYEHHDTAKNLNPSQLYSFVESYVPYAASDHIVRRIMMSGQFDHAKPVVDADPMLVSSYADEVVAYQTPEFTYVAKQNGKIKKVTDTLVIIEYDDKTTDVISLDNVNRNSDKGYYLKNDFVLDSKFKEGSTIKKGQIVAYNPSFYKRKTDGNLGLTIGKLAWVLFCDGESVWEDSCLPFSDLAESLSTKLVKRVARVIDLNTEIRNWRVDIGAMVEPNDILYEYKMLTDDQTINELYANTESLSLKEVDAHSRGKIVDIRVYYRESQNTSMSSSIKKFIRDVDDVQRVGRHMSNVDQVSDEFTKKLVDKRPQKLTRDKYSKINGDVIENGQILIEYMIETIDVLGPGDKIVVDRALKGEPSIIKDKSLRPYGAETGRKCSLMSSTVGYMARMTGGMMLHGLMLSILLDIAVESRYLLGIPAEEGSLLDYKSNLDIIEGKI